MFALAVWQFSAAADVTAVVGSATTVVGTIIGAYFGVQIGSAGREAAETGRADAARAARLALGKLDPVLLAGGISWRTRRAAARWSAGCSA